MLLFRVLPLQECCSCCHRKLQLCTCWQEAPAEMSPSRANMAREGTQVALLFKRAVTET
jgi:hypothetical protein